MNRITSKFIIKSIEGHFRWLLQLLLIFAFSNLVACVSVEKTDTIPEYEPVSSPEVAAEYTDVVSEQVVDSSPEVVAENTDTAPEYGWKSYSEVKIVYDLSFD